jgi:hypothetical protein
VVSAPSGFTDPVSSVEVFVVWSTESVDALGALAALPVVPGVFEIKAARWACAPLPVVPAVVSDVGELEPLDGELEPLDGELPPELGVLLPLTAVVTVSDELAGQLSCSSEASCALAAFSADSSVLTVACAESNVEALVGFAVLFAPVSAISSSDTLVSSPCTVAWSWVTVDAAVPFGRDTV